MRLLVLGGSFNPIHLGHLMLAEELASEFFYDRIMLVPSFMPPHKTLADDPGPAPRLDMVRAAVDGNPMYLVETCELERKGLSFTFDTLEHIVTTYALDGKPGLVIGGDLAVGFGSWRNPEGICRLAELILARRGGIPSSLPYPHRAAHNMLLPVSSTDIRSRIAEARPWRLLVPATVAQYIEEHELYRVVRA
ncbi:MAG: nicotinate (nicotinamide) nucleotide adenylyltransferase [Spirochaetes bacterium GWB1_59_5]|nr:MAG: nicotinate (nicotinamide) nucleotide adenylyltransferase [Spirochaetes bacterium GWB1_59_5]